MPVGHLAPLSGRAPRTGYPNRRNNVEPIAHCRLARTAAALRSREHSSRVEGSRRADLTLFWRGGRALQRSRHDLGRTRRISRDGLWRKQCACAGDLFRRLSTRSAVAAPGCRWLALRTVGRRDYVPIRRTPDDQRYRGSPCGQRKRPPSASRWLELRQLRRQRNNLLSRSRHALRAIRSVLTRKHTVLLGAKRGRTRPPRSTRRPRNGRGARLLGDDGAGSR